MTRKSLLFFCICFFSFAGAPAQAQDTSPAFRSTQLPLPRFVTIRADEAYVRTGPGSRYPIKWVFTHVGLPVEIILEYETWRKIRDHEGEEGWMHHSLLSGRRGGLVRGEDMVAVYRKPNSESRLRAYIEPGTVITVSECPKGDFCLARAQGYSGWVDRKFIWGIYADEIFD